MGSGLGGDEWCSMGVERLVGRDEREKIFLVRQLKNNWGEFTKIVKIRWDKFKVFKIGVG